MPFLHLTSKRNQRDFPWAEALLADQPEPTWSQIEAAVASAGDSGELYLTGGEPTLRRDLFALLAKLEQAVPQRQLVLLTNGRLFFYPKACDVLEAVKAERLTVEVIIASTRRDVHDALVGVAESFDQASKGIQNLVARGRRPRVRVLVGRHNIDHLHEIAAWVPDRFAGIDGVVWDVATLVQEEHRKLGVRPDEVSGYLESAINLLQARGMGLSVVGMPTCTITDRYRKHLDRRVTGAFRDACARCDVRAGCCGLVGTLATDLAFRAHPVVSITDAEANAEYERYLMDLLAQYVPGDARDGDAVLDAMCGRRLRNVPALRRFFGAACVVHATDVDLDEAAAIPAGTTVYRADLRQPLPTPARYAFIALFKPPDKQVMQHALANLGAALQPGGHILIVLAEHTDVDDVLDVLGRLDVEVLTSEPNALRTSIEPEHKWVIVCRLLESPSVPPFDGAQGRL